MRKIRAAEIKETVKKLCRDANVHLNEDVLSALKESLKNESNDIARDILEILIANAKLAGEKTRPLCQDTGLGVFFVEMGEEIAITEGSLTDTIAEAMSDIYLNEPYRLSVVKDPYFDRSNTNTNLPPIIHWDIVPGAALKITFLPKGGGAENMSRIKMFTPLSNLQEIKEFIIDTVKIAGGKPCPPIIVGVGIGGTFDYAALLAKKALLRPIGSSNEDLRWGEVEKELLNEINKLSIGPMGLGGITTSLGVNIMTVPCHIASLPVAVNLQCHSHRYKTVVI